MIAPTALDSLKYAVAEAEITIEWAIDHIGGAEGMTDALEKEISPAQEGLHALATTLRSALAPHVKDRADWFTYSDGRPLLTEVTVGNHTYSHLWHPNPFHDVPPARDISVPTGLEVPAHRAATISYELPSKIIIRAGDEVITEAGRGDTEVIAAWRNQPQVVALRDQAKNLEDLEAVSGERHGLSLNPTVEQLRSVIQRIEESRASQPERIFDLRTKIIIARDEALQAEPWSSFVTDIPAFTRDGEPAGSMGVPTITAKEMFGTRLALEIAAEAGNEDDVQDTLSEYFSMIREPDQMMLVAMAALSTMGTMVLPALFEVAEEKASNWDIRVNFADTARHTWAKRIRDFDSDGAA
ncbi:hypothetical protein LRL17_04115 [Rhodococcus qingshengii]|uniref:hypothetical protein n=1 Tax=Rhodococcus qingshengii TaxID=334542 RepID=UPI001E3E153D|nr:hypothetical protein [Rhodococcus qingshengii]UGQ52928.1 hypothetical protein LRL17_04115 [Rhodococcus qingshengii]